MCWCALRGLEADTDVLPRCRVPSQFRNLAAVSQKPASCSTDSQGVPTGEGGLGLQPGSMILTGRKSRNIGTTKCARSMETYYVSPNPLPTPPPAPPTVPVSPSAPGGGDGISTGVVIGSSLGGAAFLGILAGFVCCFCVAGGRSKTKKKKEKKEKDAASAAACGSMADQYPSREIRMPLMGATRHRTAPVKTPAPMNTANEALSFSLHTAFENSAP